ncbi:AAA family ATPase [Brucella pseudogrignonensis]|uniref:ATP-dependent protease Clp ATPase subunit n=1 Tax=Brucella pseudogrignonensis TaxID=419475 RepID=A0ABU1MEX2_9HYPH|nr:AAA family ATPase [Brucella pseudogrignonensis]MDR6434608.1 ATP-dependent protease Clp ATPase subunit [Brucella pseudogrignonensis]
MSSITSKIGAFYRTSPILFIIVCLVLYFKGGAMISGIATSNYRLFQIGFWVCLTLVIVAFAHNAGLFEKVWPQTFKPKWRKAFMSLVSRYSNPEALQVLINRKKKVVDFDVDDFQDRVNAGLIGQKAVVRSIGEVLYLRFNQIISNTALYVTILAGPPSVGKTEAGKQIAKVLGYDFKLIDMSQYKDLNSFGGLIGNQEIYRGSEKPGEITGQLEINENTVFILDEIDRAHENIFDIFLIPFNEGHFINGKTGKPISCKKAIFIFTTNKGHERITEAHKGNPDEDKLAEITTQILTEEGFDSALLSRVDSVETFSQLADEDAAEIVVLKINSLVKQYGLELEDSAKALDPDLIYQALIRMEALQKSKGVRGFMKVLEKSFGKKLADASKIGAKTIRLIMPGNTLIDVDLIITEYQDYAAEQAAKPQRMTPSERARAAAEMRGD